MNSILMASTMAFGGRRTLNLVTPRVTSSFIVSSAKPWKLPGSPTLRYFASSNSLASTDKSGDNLGKAWTKASMKRRIKDNLNANNDAVKDAVKQVLGKDLGPPIPIAGQQIQFKGRHVCIGAPFVIILFLGGFLEFLWRLIFLTILVAGCLM